MPDLNESAELVLISLVTEGLCRIDETDFTFLSNLVEQIKIGYYTQFYSFILKKLNKLSGWQRERKRISEILNTSDRELLKTYTKSQTSNLVFSKEVPQLSFVWRIYRERPQIWHGKTN